MDKYTGQPKKAFWKEEDPDYEYEEGRLCNITYSNNTKPTASRLDTSATECSCLAWNSAIVFVLVMTTIYATWATLCLCFKTKHSKSGKKVRFAKSVVDTRSKPTKASLEEIEYHQWNDVDDKNYFGFDGYISMSSRETELEEVGPGLPEKRQDFIHYEVPRKLLNGSSIAYHGGVPPDQSTSISAHPCH